MATEVLVPPLGQTVDTMTLVTWYKNEGERVAQGDPLFAIETDKATLDVEAPASGVLRQVTAQPGDEVKVLSAIALIAAPDETVESPQRPSSPPPVMQDASSFLPGREKRERDRGDKDHRIFISPRARRLAEEHNIPLTALPATGPEGAIVERDVRTYLRLRPKATPVAQKMAAEAGLDLLQLTGSGPGGKIIKEDVECAIKAPEAPTSAPLPPAPEVEVLERVPLKGVRGVIAECMGISVHTTARVTLVMEVDATEFVETRNRLKARVEEEWGFAPGYNDLLAKIVATALRKFPYMNARLTDDAIEYLAPVNMGMAVDTERGLLVPVIRNADKKSLREFGTEFRELVDRARNGRALPDDLAGGTFTITNLGMYDVDAFTPVINLPEAAILGAGHIAPKPVVHDGEVVVRHMCTLSLVFDHRLVDGAPAARFLQYIKDLIEEPYLWLAVV